MGGATDSFLRLLDRRGSTVLFHKDDSTHPCPCRTPEGSRDPQWHLDHPDAPICNAAGFLPSSPAEIIHQYVKAFVQPVMGAQRMLAVDSGQIMEMFGAVESDDHIGIFPVTYGGSKLNFFNWGRSGEDYILYNISSFQRYFTVVGATLIPDPLTGDPEHHYEVALRLIKA